MRVEVFTTTSVHTAFHPKHSKLRPRSRKQTRYIEPNTPVPLLTHLFSLSLLRSRWGNSIRTIHPEAIFYEVLRCAQIFFEQSDLLTVRAVFMGTKSCQKSW